MKIILRTIVGLAAFGISTTVSQAQAPPAPQQGVATDVYHVMFVKATPGQGAALAKELQHATRPSWRSILLIDRRASHYSSAVARGAVAAQGKVVAILVDPRQITTVFAESIPAARHAGR